MDGLTVTFGKWNTRYFPGGDLVMATEAIADFDELEDRLLAGHPRMRRILMRGRPDWPLHRYYLHWSDGSDLESLDRRVASGTATEADFAGAVVGEPLSITHPVCGADLRVVALVVVVPLFADRVERSRAHAYRRTCPVCGNRLGGGVLEFIAPEAP